MFRIFDYKPVHDLPYIPMCRHIICSLGHIVISSGHYAIFIYNLISYLIYIFAMIHIGKLVIVFKPFSTQCINNYIPLVLSLAAYIFYQAAHKKQVIQSAVFPTFFHVIPPMPP